MEIDRFCADFQFAEKHAILVHASPERVFESIRNVDLSESRIIRTLIAIRMLPQRLLSKTAQRPTFNLEDDILDFGFIKLAEDFPREIVFGIVGRFWRLRDTIHPLPAASFADFQQQGFAKTAWNFYLRNLGGDRTELITETRVQCFGSGASRKFRCYWLIIRIPGGLIRRLMLRMIRKDAEKGDGD